MLWGLLWKPWVGGVWLRAMVRGRCRGHLVRCLIACGSVRAPVVATLRWVRVLRFGARTWAGRAGLAAAWGALGHHLGALARLFGVRQGLGPVGGVRRLALRMRPRRGLVWVWGGWLPMLVGHGGLGLVGTPRRYRAVLPGFGFGRGLANRQLR